VLFNLSIREFVVELDEEEELLEELKNISIENKNKYIK
jgi:hypothetical protein